MDTGDLNLPAYKYQLEQVMIYFCFYNSISLIVFYLFFQVELALKAKPDDPELLKLKQDLDVIFYHLSSLFIAVNLFYFRK